MQLSIYGYSYYMIMEKSMLQLSHAQIMRLLPMETGYLIAENGKPSNTSLSIAMIMQAIAIMQNPYYKREEYIN